ncbi:MAG: diguanylate cyclase, partial [Gemmatimonadaceae bacterium]|nr:diguanylate cyclase [Gemmatimonadaceae bacterium]
MTAETPLDSLTGLPLRAPFVAAARDALAASAARGVACSLLVLDLDRLGALVAAHGTAAGDRAVVLVADLLRTTLRGGDFAARWGSDVLVALLPGAPPDRAREVAERIAAAARAHAELAIDGEPGGVTVSIGVASAPEHATDPEALFAAADRAMYHVKRRGRDGVAVAGTGRDAAPAVDRVVGRTDELRALAGALDEAIDGAARLVLVAGEAGVGKTTLVRQLAPIVRRRGGALVVGRSLEAALVQPPYAPWVEVVASLERLRAGEPPALAGSPSPASIAALIGDGVAPLGVRLPVTPLALRAVVPETARWPALARIVPALARRTPHVAPTGSRVALLVELAAYLAEAARRQPLVVVLDDFDRADAASWDALEHVLAQLDRDRLCLVVTVREEALSPDQLTRLRRMARDPRVRELPLARLTRDALRRWTEAAFHGEPPARELLAYLYTRTEGNPLRVVQLLRTLVDEGGVTRTDAGWRWRPLDTLALPVDLPALMARRLARLDEADRLLLATAATVGREFDVALVADAAGVEPTRVRTALDAAQRASVVQPAHGRAGERVVFVHALLMAALLDPLPADVRRALHARVAAATLARQPASLALVALHHDRAGEQAAAHATALAAAERARAAYAHEEAEQLLRIAERNAPDAAAAAMVHARLA